MVQNFLQSAHCSCLEIKHNLQRSSETQKVRWEEIWKPYWELQKRTVPLNYLFIQGQQWEDHKFQALNIVLSIRKNVNGPLSHNSLVIKGPSVQLGYYSSHWSPISAPRYCFSLTNKLMTTLRPQLGRKDSSSVISLFTSYGTLKALHCYTIHIKKGARHFPYLPNFYFLHLNKLIIWNYSFSPFLSAPQKRRGSFTLATRVGMVLCQQRSDIRVGRFMFRNEFDTWLIALSCSAGSRSLTF